MKTTSAVSKFSSIQSSTASGEHHDATSYLVMAFGTKGLNAAEQFMTETADGVPAVLSAVPAAHPSALGALRTSLAGARGSVHIVLAGPESDVFAARAVAIEFGAVESELLLRVTEAENRRVYCPHCTTITLTTAGIGQLADCAGCDRSLLVHDHFSRRTATYLGYMDNAEEIPLDLQRVAV